MDNAPRLTKQAILQFLYQQRTVLHAIGVRKIGLFGSYVRNKQTPISDIDILVDIEAFTFAKYAQLWDFLEDNLGCKVDLVPESDLRPELRANILAEVAYVEEL